MNLMVCLCVTLLLSTATVSLRLSSRSSIVGGEDAAPGRWPWMVYLYITYENQALYCGGSLINSQWVLTAGHCLYKPRQGTPILSLSYAQVGELQLREPVTGERHYLGRFLVHNDYSSTNGMFYNDIALVQLKEAVSFSDTVKPVVLPSHNVPGPEAECWVTGWGDVAEDHHLGGEKTLQQLRLPLVDDKTCRQAYPKTSNNQLCAGYMQGGKDACQGDSGGPLVCKSFEQFVQVGVVSFGRGCARRGYPGVYTRVLSYTKFIQRAVRKYR
ncbi:hypothetical protein AALO_G00282290 [Alosa alosa]|uniref:Peptidase S1 domain-containing protein n=1 Tax=Alosa alosa TaxID=278164 RepID=A0AAV6FKT6_9TELE|nr:hypothetical protein AALO_G00282290 [Alosa alosa]